MYPATIEASQRLAMAWLAVVFVAFGFVAPSASAQYSDVLTCDFSMVEAGDTVEASADGFLPGSTVQITVTDQALPPGTSGASAAVDGVSANLTAALLSIDISDTSAFDASFTIPANTPDGDYFVLAEGTSVTGAPRSLACPVTVDSNVDEIAFTGSSTRPVVQVALVVIAMGALLVFAGRRRSNPAAVNASV